MQYRADEKYERKVLRVLTDLAWQVRHDVKWEPKPGAQCGQCSYSQYCTAVNREPIPEPSGNKVASLQIAFSLSA